MSSNTSDSKGAVKVGWDNTKVFCDDVATKAKAGLVSASDAISSKYNDATTKKETPPPTILGSTTSSVPVTTTKNVTTEVPTTTTSNVPVTTTSTMPAEGASTGQKREGFFGHLVDQTRAGLHHCSDAIAKKFEGGAHPPQTGTAPVAPVVLAPTPPSA